MNVDKVKRKIKCDKSKDEIIEQVMQNNEEYFKALGEQLGEDCANQARESYRKELEEELKNYKQGEEVEIEMTKLTLD